jgi:hypothetical protein
MACLSAGVDGIGLTPRTTKADDDDTVVRGGRGHADDVDPPCRVATAMS